MLLVIAAAVGLVIFLVRPRPESEDELQRRQGELLGLLARLTEADCRRGCVWQAEHSRVHQEALGAGLSALKSDANDEEKL